VTMVVKATSPEYKGRSRVAYADPVTFLQLAIAVSSYLYRRLPPAMLPPFSVPVYEPLPYALADLTFAQLSPFTQHYLVQVAGLVPPNAPGLNSIEKERSRISKALFRCLMGTSIDLVELRHEAAAMSRELEAGIRRSADWYAASVQRQERRLHEVLGVLLPEREVLFNEYLMKFDALIWLDQEGRENYSVEDWQRHRDARLNPILDYTNRALVAMDEAVTKRTMTTDGYTWSRTPQSRSPFPSSFRSPCRGTSRPRSNTFTARAGREGPDSEGFWPKGRRGSWHV
jgi:hypothetical protein